MITSRRLGKNPLEVPSLGLGSAPLGNIDSTLSTEEAVNTVAYALDHGISIVDTAPLYGRGRAERRVGLALAGRQRDSYLLSTKVGRVLNQAETDFVYDFSADGVLRSFESSLERLGVDHIEILHIHDPDGVDDAAAALRSAFPALLRLREEGAIKAIGSGMNQWQIWDPFVRSEELDFDLFLLAGRYTLLEQGALDFLDLCLEKQIGILAGGVYNSGILATGPGPEARYNYAKAPDSVLEKARALQAVCSRYNVPLYVAAQRFTAAHPAITTLMLGAMSVDEVQANLAGHSAATPTELWSDLRQQGLIDARAPVP